MSAVDICNNIIICNGILWDSTVDTQNYIIEFYQTQLLSLINTRFNFIKSEFKLQTEFNPTTDTQKIPNRIPSNLAVATQKYVSRFY